MPRELNAGELRAWRAFLDAHASLMRRLEAELVPYGMTLAEFDVLIQLRLSRDGRLRMTDLSERVRLSPSGITRLVDRLASQDLLTRRRCESDRRGTWAILTAAGRKRIDQIQPTHLRSVQQHFARPLSSSQLQALTSALEAVAGRPGSQVSSTV